jgi:hypothetical protein
MSGTTSSPQATRLCFIANNRAIGLVIARLDNRQRGATIASSDVVNGAGGLLVMTMPTALEIARQATLKPVTEIAEGIGIPPWLVEQHGDHVAKIDLKVIEELQDRPKAKYVVVTAITPPARRGQDHHHHRSG